MQSLDLLDVIKKLILKQSKQNLAMESMDAVTLVKLNLIALNYVMRPIL